MITFLILYTTFELYQGERGYFNFEGEGSLNFNKRNYTRNGGAGTMAYGDPKTSRWGEGLVA